MELELLSNKKKRHPLRYIVLCTVFVVFLFSAFWMIATNNQQIKEKELELDAINQELNIQRMDNVSLEKYANYTDEEYMQYVIQKAHKDLDYVRHGEIVFVITAGN